MKTRLQVELNRKLGFFSFVFIIIIIIIVAIVQIVQLACLNGSR